MGSSFRHAEFEVKLECLQETSFLCQLWVDWVQPFIHLFVVFIDGPAEFFLP